VTWVKIDDKFPRHRRLRSLGRDIPSKWLHTVALCFCAEHLTDGMIEEYDLEQIIGDADMPKATGRRCVPKLVAAGLWEEVDGGYQIRDFLDYNPSSEDVKAKRQAARDRMAALRSLDVRANKTRSSQEVREPQARTQAPTPRTKSSGLLDHERSAACQDLLDRLEGADNGTPRVVERFCKQLPKDRIDRVTATLRVGVKPAIAVAALKREVKAYEAEVLAEGAA